MPRRLPDGLIEQIKNSQGRIVDVASRSGVSTATVSRYRPTKRKHLTDAEHDQIITEWIARIRTTDTAQRLGVSIQTIQNARRRAMTALIREKSNGAT